MSFFFFHVYALLLMEQVDVLEYIHENEYVHADIKAANLMQGHRDPERVSPL